MRLLTSATALCGLAFSSLAAGRPQQQPFTVYLHPSPADTNALAPPAAAPTLDAAQADAVLMHHMSGGGRAADAYEKAPSGWGKWVHLLGGSGQKGAEAKDSEKARVVIVQGDVDLEATMPTGLSSQNPAFYLTPSAETVTYLRPYILRAKSVIEHIAEALPETPQFLKDIFTLSTTKTSELLHKQLQALSTLAERLPWNDRSRAPSDLWESTLITALGREKAGADDGLAEDEIRREGQAVFKAALEKMTSDDSQPPLVLIILPAREHSHGHKHGHARRSVAASAAASTSSSAAPLAKSYDPACYPSNRTCTADTNGCAGHGVCVQSGSSDDTGNATSSAKKGDCWSCQCAPGYLGQTCVKADYTFQTTLLIFTPLLLLTVLMGSVGLLNAIGGEALPSTLSLSMNAPNKRD